MSDMALKKMANKMARTRKKTMKEHMDEDEIKVNNHLTHDIKESKRSIQEDKELKKYLRKKKEND